MNFDQISSETGSQKNVDNFVRLSRGKSTGNEECVLKDYLGGAISQNLLNHFFKVTSHNFSKKEI